ncbi:hypothetical protein SNEBB_005605 [Seison nebaliae]|nr:hypothetical protein SNEBB_005605 [Seison nebaliae]
MWFNSENTSEILHFYKIRKLFKEYRNLHNKRFYENWITYDKLLGDESVLLERLDLELDSRREAIERNQTFFDNVVTFNEHSQLPNKIDDQMISTPIELLDRLTSMLKQIVREWTEFGKNERIQNEIFIKQLNELFPDKNIRHKIEILIPGCGLGRLNYDIHQNGYSVEGNEISLFCLLISNLLLNSSEKYIICPYATQFSNVMDINQTIKCFVFPEKPEMVSSSERNDERMGRFSMVAGDFLHVYAKNHDEYYNCIVTNFFIDTGKNIVEYIRTFHQILKEDGWWLNFGPLLYHYENDGNKNVNSICLTGENVRLIINKYFEIKKWDYPIESSYTNNDDMMLTYRYKCINIVCKKRVLTDNH